MYRILKGGDYFVSMKVPWKKSYIKSHPYLSFSYKENSVIDKNQKLNYSFCPKKYYSFKDELKLNNFGHFGEDFKTKSKKKRVMCLGASTTANNISDGDKDYTYPKLLEEYLNKNSNEEFEVFNCGIGGWMSPDIMINFMLNLIQLKPDYVILYHGYNDLQIFLMDEFKRDYSAGRGNLGDVISKIKLSYYLPKIKGLHSYEFLKDKLFGTGNIRNDVFSMTTKQKINYDNEYKDLSIENDILKNILIICKHYNIKCILSSFAYYNTKTTESLKLNKGVNKQNHLRKKLANEFKYPFVNQSVLNKNKDNFVDSIHFSPKGMKSLAERFGKKILEINND
tara:strand:- start:532 stop:1545 length:1014 start_codon:yes stop_codon:yes gene_type:complete